jgi:hypothetical protein
MTDAMTDVTDEFIAEMSRSDVDTTIRSMAREIQRRRASDRWIPWSVGDALPADGLYWVTFDKNFGVAMCDARVPRLFLFDSVTAYWSRPLPDPFDSSMGAEHG